jgi:hypothetical protein
MPIATAPPVNVMVPSLGPKLAVAGAGGLDAQLANAQTPSAAITVTKKRYIGFPRIISRV